MHRIAPSLALALTLALAFALAPPPASAAVPPMVNFQGRLLASDGSPEVGILSIGFAMYTADTGGTPVWSESQTVAFADGFYSVMLGTVSPLPSGLLTDPLWISVTVEGTELLPRMRVGSVFFAMRAGAAESLLPGATGTGSGLDADSVDGLDSADFATAGHSHAPGDADTIDGLDSTAFSLNGHSHAPGDADTLDGIDSSGFALSGHSHAPGDATTLDGLDSTDFAGSSHTHAGADVDGEAFVASATCGALTGTGHSTACPRLCGGADCATLCAAAGGTAFNSIHVYPDLQHTYVYGGPGGTSCGPDWCCCDIGYSACPAPF